MADRITGQSALQAYRDDVPLGGATPTKNDGDAILVATLLRQSLAASVDDPNGVRIRGEAARIARESLGSEALAIGCTYDDWPATSDVDVLRLLAQRTEHAGWLLLAQHVLESLAVLPLAPMAQGLIQSDRMRLSRKHGHLDLCAAQSEEVIRVGERLGSSHLIVMGHLGLGSVAQSRGNFVEFRQHQMDALRIAAGTNVRRPSASAHEGLGMYFGLQGDYDAAVVHLWAAYQMADAAPVLTAAALGGLAQTLMLAGHLEDARRLWRIQFSGPLRLQEMLPVFGGYAIASAHLGDLEAVDWAVQHVRRLARNRHYPREIADALMECATALGQIGQAAQAGVLRRRAERLAVTYGFYDLTFRESAKAGGVLPTGRQRFTGSAARVKAEIEQLPVPSLPAAVQVASG